MSKELIQMTPQDIKLLLDNNSKEVFLKWLTEKMTILQLDLGSMRAMVDGMSNQHVIKAKLLNFIDTYLL